MKSVKIPNTVKKIYHQAFVGTKVKKVTFGKKVKIVDTYAFNNSKKLNTVTMNAGLKRIDGWAFSGCKNFLKL